MLHPPLPGLALASSEVAWIHWRPRDAAAVRNVSLWCACERICRHTACCKERHTDFNLFIIFRRQIIHLSILGLIKNPVIPGVGCLEFEGVLCTIPVAKKIV